jgi:hypothetical protein
MGPSIKGPLLISAYGMHYCAFHKSEKWYQPQAILMLPRLGYCDTITLPRSLQSAVTSTTSLCGLAYRSTHIHHCCGDFNRVGSELLVQLVDL